MCCHLAEGSRAVPWLVLLVVMIFSALAAGQLPPNAWAPAQYVVQGQTGAWYDSYPSEGICPTTDNVNCTVNGSTVTPFLLTGAISVGACESSPPSHFSCSGNTSQSGATFHYYVDGIEVGSDGAHNYTANYPFYWEPIDEIGDYNIWWGSTYYLISDSGVYYTFNSPGTHTIAIKINDSPVEAMSTNVTVTLNSSLVVTTTSLPQGIKNGSYNGYLAASGGTVPYTWSIIGGALPSGLSLDSSSGAIAGVPISQGTSTFTVQVRDANYSTATKALNITINESAGAPLEVATSSLPDGTVSVPYSASLIGVGGTAPYSWSLVSGTLPGGLSLNTNNGVISGSPTAAGTSTFVVQVRDSLSNTASRTLGITVSTGSSGACNSFAVPEALFLVSVDYYYQTIDGIYFIGTSKGQGIVTVFSAFPQCVQLGYGWLSLKPLELIAWGPPVQHTQYWASSYYWSDTGEQYVAGYPDFKVGGMTVYGINVTNGIPFETTYEVTLLILETTVY
jgi:hypothetical protein